MQTVDVNLRGKVALVTGATDGIGKEAARMLARSGAKVLVHGRSRERAEAAAHEIRESTGSLDVDFLVADFASLTQVRELVNEIRKTYPSLQLLINNAGTFNIDRRLTEDGFELTFQVQYLAPYLLTQLLSDILAGNRPARIVNLTSILHKGAKLEFGNLQGERGYEGHAAYASSKLAMTLYTFELAERLRDVGITVNCVHPGGVRTKLLRAGYGDFGAPPELGARAPFEVATAEELEAATGKYYESRDGGIEPAEPDPRTHDRELRRKLWNLTEDLIALGLSRAQTRKSA